jgi:hypothetical protein
VLAGVISELSYIGGILESGEVLCHYNVYHLSGGARFP